MNQQEILALAQFALDLDRDETPEELNEVHHEVDSEDEEVVLLEDDEDEVDFPTDKA
jgi:hypothetical protein